MNIPTDRIAVLVNSCDAYEETWPYMFKLLFKYMENNGDARYSYYLNTETKTFNDLRVNELHFNEKSWSSRLINCLKSLEEQYVVLLLDDFFITRRVDTDEFFKVIRFMDSSDIDAVYFKHITGQMSDKLFLNRYIEMNPDVKYYMTFQACVWKRESLIRILVPDVSPWDIEEKNLINRDVHFRVLCDSLGSFSDCSKDVFPYFWAKETGYGIYKSKWLWNNKKLFRDNGMVFKRRKLGYLSRFEYLLKRFRERVTEKVKRR